MSEWIISALLTVWEIITYKHHMNCEIKYCMHNINSSQNRIDVLRSRMIRMLYKILLFITSLFENIFLQQTQHKRSNIATLKIMKDGAQSVIKFSITHTNPPLFIIYIRIFKVYFLYPFFDFVLYLETGDWWRFKSLVVFWYREVFSCAGGILLLSARLQWLKSISIS